MLFQRKCCFVGIKERFFLTFKQKCSFYRVRCRYLSAACENCPKRAFSRAFSRAIMRAFERSKRGQFRGQKRAVLRAISRAKKGCFEGIYEVLKKGWNLGKIEGIFERSQKVVITSCTEKSKMFFFASDLSAQTFSNCGGTHLEKSRRRKTS